jgi:hypothetical protein
VRKLTHGLIVRADPLNLILDGTKVWEVRGHRTQLRGPIALIEAGSGHVVGVAELVDVVGPMSAAAISASAGRTGYKRLPVNYREYFAWVLRSARRLKNPVHYRHPSGAVVWVRLAGGVAAKVVAQQ